ncbi:hypothetical protein J2X24_000923 [Asticcacaulis solisilvae]|nr:hypothetical protein [Asticcacaulis solisilvae]MDR6799420.1 hypothetical protein [Asticcacaulis sp. BE141]
MQNATAKQIALQCRTDLISKLYFKTFKIAAPQQ